MGGGVDPADHAAQIGLQLNADTAGEPISNLPVAAGVAAVNPEVAAASDALPSVEQVQPPGGAPLPTPTLPAPPTAQDVPPDASQWLDATCPYLRSADGTWRSVVPQRGQRCWGQSPPAALEPATQERLCRTESHLQCEIYVAAERQHLDSLARDHVAPERLEGRFGVLVRPSTLVLSEAGQGLVQAPRQIGAGPRTRVAVGLGLLGVFVVIALFAGIGNGGAPVATPPAVAFASPTQGPSQTAAFTAAPTPTQTPSLPPPTAPATPVLTPTPPPTPQPTPRPTGPIQTTYRVKKGDTLAGIAAKFGVTKKQIRAVNDFGDPPHLRYGTLINIPYP